MLTEAGADLLPVVQALALWGEKHTAAPGPGRLEVLHEVCGRTSDDPSTCSACGDPADTGDHQLGAAVARRAGHPAGALTSARASGSSVTGLSTRACSASICAATAVPANSEMADR